MSWAVLCLDKVSELLMEGVVLIGRREVMYYLR
jgi:hypothetical protein